MRQADVPRRSIAVNSINPGYTATEKESTGGAGEASSSPPHSRRPLGALPLLSQPFESEPIPAVVLDCQVLAVIVQIVIGDSGTKVQRKFRFKTF